MDEKINLKEKYCREIASIEERLSQLESGNIYEFTNVRADGYLATVAGKLRADIYDLIKKIVNKLPSDEDEILDAVLSIWGNNKKD